MAPRGGCAALLKPEAIRALFPGDAAVRRFRRLLVAELQRGFFDKHLWLSIWDRPPRSRFTRVQRATCCVLLVCLFLGANAVWYGVVGDAAYRWVPTGFLTTSSCPSPPAPPNLPQPGSLSSPAAQCRAGVRSDPAECRHGCRRPGVQRGRLSRLLGHPVSLPHVPEQGGLGPMELPQGGVWALSLGLEARSTRSATTDPRKQKSRLSKPQMNQGDLTSDATEIRAEWGGPACQVTEGDGQGPGKTREEGAT